MLDRDTIDFLYKELSKHIKKNFKGMFVTLYVVGGANLTMTTSFREGTHDIDVIKQRSIDLRDIVLQLEEQYGLEHNWLNDDVMFSDSFSMNLRKYVSSHTEYGPLRVSYISLTAICAMKIRANRTERPDLEDALLICGGDVEPEDVAHCYKDLYNKEMSSELLHSLSQFKCICKESDKQPKEVLSAVVEKYPDKSLPEAIDLFYLLR